MLKKNSSRILSALLVLLITFLLLTTLVPAFQITGDVKAASSATIALDVSQGYAGDYVTITGSGFTPNEDVNFTWDDQPFLSLGFVGGMPAYQRPSIEAWSWSALVRTDALGNFIVQLQVPKFTNGTYVIAAEDTATSATAMFTINPRVMLRNQYAYKKHGIPRTPSGIKSSEYYIELFLAEGFVGDRLALRLSGFGEGEIVEVSMGTIDLGEFTVGSGSGKGYLFNASAVGVPEMSIGDYIVTATGKSSGITTSASFEVKPELFLSRPPPDTPTLSGFDWVYTFDSFGKSWYSSVNSTANSTFLFEATGLTGETISSVSVVYDDGAPIVCTVAGTLTIQNGSTEGINSSTVPFVSGSPFTAGLSPNATIPSAIPSGKMLSVTITTSGAGGASFTFNNQLFSSSPGEEWNDGAFMWVEGDSTISSDGTSLSGKVTDVNKLAATGLLRYSWTHQWPVVATSTGSIVNKLDLDAIWGWTLTPYNQSLTPVSFYDLDDNDVWGSSEPVYIDYDNSGNVTVGDQRVTSQTIDGKFYQAAWGPNVGATDPDLNRTLTTFPPETRPSYYDPGFWPKWVYLDTYDPGSVSEGDVRISAVPLYAWWMWGWDPDVNGFTAVSLSAPNMPGGGLTYDVGLWSAWANNDFSVNSTAKMEILADLEVTDAPTSYQSIYYVTEGSSVRIQGKGFHGNETLDIFVGGEYVANVTPDLYGSFGLDIMMPALAGGEQSITSRGATTNNTASTTVTFTPALSVWPAWRTGAAIMVTGKGFEAGTYQIIFDGAGIGEAVTSSFIVADIGGEAGQINMTFRLPAGVEGCHIIDIVKTSIPTISAWYGAGYCDIGGSARQDTPFPTDSEFQTITIPNLIVIYKELTQLSTGHQEEAPSIALDNNGNLHIVWVGNETANLYYMMVDRFGNILINETCLDPNPNATSYHVRRAKIGIDSENNVHIVFHGQYTYESWPDYTNYTELDAHEVFYLKIDPYLDDMDGSAADYVGITVIPEIIISKDDGNKSRAANVAVDSEDNIHVVWFDKMNDRWSTVPDGELHYLVMNVTGGIVVPETNVTAGFWTDMDWSEPEIVVDSQGDAHVFFVTENWTGYSCNWRDIYYTMIDGTTGNVLINNTQLTDSNQTWRYSRPFVDIDSEDQIHIVWHDSRFYSNETGEHEIFYMKIDPYLDNRNGTSADPEAIKVVDEMLISNNDHIKSYLANIAVDEHDLAHLLWINEWTESYGDIYYAQVNATGHIIVPETRITHSKGILNFAEWYYSSNRNPEIAVADWRAFIVDMAYNLDTGYYDVWLTISFYDTAPPDIGTPTREPSGDVEEGQPVNILANVTDIESGVQNVTLSYSTDGGETWHNAAMEKTTGDTYQGEILGLPAGTHVQYKIIAYDNVGNPAVKDNAGEYYVYTVIPEIPTAIILLLFMFLALIAVALTKKKFTAK